MATETKVDIPGNLTLDDLENSINTKENVEGAILVGLTKAQSGKKNVGSFVKAQVGVDVPELVLIHLDDGQTSDDVKPEGKDAVFESAIFVSNEEQNVAGFR